MFLAAQGSTTNLGLAIPGWAWLAFLAGMAGLLLFDLLVLNREAHEPTMRDAAILSVFWVGIGLLFALVLWAWLGGAAASQYLAGYVVEESLSVDNVFVWALILGFFAVPRELQHRVLFWGIFGALLLRAGFIFAGVAVLQRFSWVEYLFGLFLVVTAVRVALQTSVEKDLEGNSALRLIRRLIPVTPDYRGQRFFVREGGRRFATPLFVVLVLVEVTDVVFAVDSVPAILAISHEQFIVFSSNALAIMGLRALYFLVASATRSLAYLHIGLGLILGFVGVKMLTTHWFLIPTGASLLVIVVILMLTVIASLLYGHKYVEPKGETAGERGGLGS